MSEPPQAAALALGVNLAGYFDATSGVGAAARQLGEALRAVGVAVAPLALSSDGPRQPGADSPPARGAAPHPVTIVCANPEGMAGARDQAPAAFEGRHVVGMWWWEVDVLPQRWLRAFDLVDEVWAGSRFVADALAALSPVPVVHVPLPVPEPQAAPAGRAELGLPEGFLFGFVYDYASVAARKNPLGLIEAYRRAVPRAQRDRVKLVLKSLGGSGDGRWAREHEQVLAAADRHGGITVIDRQLTSAEKNALIGELDCYVSLHRSEGFGLTIAEAMLLGTPVIATDYGGSRDFVTAFNARPVDYRLVGIGPGNEPYPAGGTWAEPDLDHAAKRMRLAWQHPDRLRARAQRARAEVLATHAPAAAGRAMADRLARVLTAPHDGGGRLSALDVDGVRARMARAPYPGARSQRHAGGARAAMRDAVLRALRPYTVHQRLVDEEIVRALQSLDERVRGLAAAQQVLAAELARLGLEADGDEA